MPATEFADVKGNETAQDFIKNAPPRYNPEGEAATIFKKAMAEVKSPPSEADKPAAPAAPAAPAEPKPTATVKTPETPAQPDADIPTTIKPEHVSDWKKMKARFAEEKAAIEKERDTLSISAKEAKAQLDALKVDFEKAKAVSIIKPEELEAIKKDRETYEAILSRVALEQEPKFVKAFTQKTEAILARAKEVAGPEFGDQAQKLLQLPEGEFKAKLLADFYSNLDTRQQALMGSLENRMSELNAERNAALAASKEDLKKLREIEKAESENRQSKVMAEYDATINAVLAEASKKESGFTDFQEIEGNEEHNKLAKTAAEDARKIAKEIAADNHAARAQTAFWAAKGRLSLQTDQLRDALISKKDEEIAKLNEAIAAFKGIAPKTGDADRGTPSEKAPGDPGKPSTFIAQIKELMSGNT